MTPKTYKAMSERERMQFALSRAAAAVAGRSLEAIKSGSHISDAAEQMLDNASLDKHVGKRIRQRRWLCEVTQQQLAEQIGVKLQQIQRYETGANAVPVSKLWDIASALSVTIDFFFEGLIHKNAVSEPGSHSTEKLLVNKEAMDLVRAYYAIPENQRLRLRELASALIKKTG